MTVPRLLAVLALSVSPLPVWADDLPTYTSRLFVTPTARVPGSGHGAFGLTELYFPWAEIGIGGRVSVFAATVFPVDGASGLVVGPKLQVLRTSRVQAAAGFYQFVGDGGGGIAYAVTTFGDARRSLTAGVSYGYGAASDDSGGSSLVVTLGGDVALNRYVSLVAENYLGGAGLGLPDDTFMAGVRFHGGHLTGDVAVVVPFYEGGAGGAAPLITIGWTF